MKTFEERYSAWLAGDLPAVDSEAFEAELDRRGPEPEGLMEDPRLGALLRGPGAAPRLGNPDFFNHQLSARIRRGQGQSTFDLGRWFSALRIPRMALGGFACLLMAFILFRAWIVPQQKKMQQPLYMANIVEVHAADDSIFATALHSDQDGVTVLWLDGLPFLSDEYQLQ